MFLNNTDQQVREKMMILYIIKTFEFPMTNSQLTDFILEIELMNYFNLQQFSTELVESKMLEYSESDDTYYYLITEQGISTLELFLDRLTKSEKEKIDQLVIEKKHTVLKATEVFSDYEKIGENDYLVTLKVVENMKVLFDLSINVVTNKQAKAICNNWKKNAKFMYGDIINLLIKD
ncbi:MAG: DUF4364 family protein [Firmicutes bacterium]|nr:DUF4364 family protein [Bacillota bacterium]